ncbi:MAG: molybdate ABC transporter substrate-binding protein [Ilumatobacteraceae bacterium]
MVFASASLTEAYTAIGDAFMAAHPGVEVTFNFAASSELAAQIADGAPADVLATADTTTMQVAIDGLAAAGAEAPSPAQFATNSMQIVVGPGNPKGVEGLADLADPDLLVVLCAVDTPCGTYAATVLENAGVAVTPVSFEQNVKGVLSKVTSGEADAGIVYRTDVIAAGADATGVDIDAAVNVVAEYPIAALTGDLAAAFEAFVLGAEGRSILSKFGFGLP